MFRIYSMSPNNVNEFCLLFLIVILPFRCRFMWHIHHCYPWASYQIRKIAGCACARNAGNVFPHCRFQRKPLVSDPGMHHGTCVTHVPWCMSGSLTCGDGENVPGIPGACAPAILRIWQEAHCTGQSYVCPSASEAIPNNKCKTCHSYEPHYNLLCWFQIFHGHWEWFRIEGAISDDWNSYGTKYVPLDIICDIFQINSCI